MADAVKYLVGYASRDTGVDCGRVVYVCYGCERVFAWASTGYHHHLETGHTVAGRPLYEPAHMAPPNTAAALLPPAPARAGDAADREAVDVEALVDELVSAVRAQTFDDASYFTSAGQRNATALDAASARTALLATVRAQAERVAALESRVSEYEEAEAACCPEDVGFPEYIRALESRELEQERERCPICLGSCLAEPPHTRERLVEMLREHQAVNDALRAERAAREAGEDSARLDWLLANCQTTHDDRDHDEGTGSAHTPIRTRRHIDAARRAARAATGEGGR